MPTQEERVQALEQAVSGYRAILRDIAYELTMVKGLAVDQEENVRNLGQGVGDIKTNLGNVETNLGNVQTDLGHVGMRLGNVEAETTKQTELLNQILSKLTDKN